MTRPAVLAFALLLAAGAVTAAPLDHKRRAAQWNAFVEGLLELHRARLAAQVTYARERVGGYAGRPGFYREVSHYAEEGDRLLARVQWEREPPGNLHAIELFVHDRQGRVVRDYVASFLPDARNAPFQALVSLHGHGNGLAAFRQFDASGELLYEQCRGAHGGAPVNLALEAWDLPYRPGEGDPPVAAYHACFDSLPATADLFLDPRNDPSRPGKSPGAGLTADDPMTRIAALDRLIAADPDDPALRVRRGDVLFTTGAFATAVADYDRALELDDATDAAYFGRGMALGRMGRIDEAIADLTTYIARHPDSALAHTKRGIRHFWNGDEKSAESDLRRALELDPGSAEANDDLGVVLARRGEHHAAIVRFRAAIRLEPDYRKAHHNLALVLHIRGDDDDALAAVDRALALEPDARASLELKGAVLHALGRMPEAEEARRLAAQLPEDDWSERARLR